MCMEVNVEKSKVKVVKERNPADRTEIRCNGKETEVVFIYEF